MTQAYPPISQFLHDAFYTTLASIIAGIMEIWLCHQWAIGNLPYSELSRFGEQKYTLNVFPSYIYKIICGE